MGFRRTSTTTRVRQVSFPLHRLRCDVTTDLRRAVAFVTNISSPVLTGATVEMFRRFRKSNRGSIMSIPSTQIPFVVVRCHPPEMRNSHLDG